MSDLTENSAQVRKVRTEQNQRTMNETERTQRLAEIEAHPDFQSTYHRWHSIALAAGRSREEAHERAYGLAVNWIGRRLDAAAYDARRVGPPARAAK